LWLLGGGLLEGGWEDENLYFTRYKERMGRDVVNQAIVIHNHKIRYILKIGIRLFRRLEKEDFLSRAWERKKGGDFSYNFLQNLNGG